MFRNIVTGYLGTIRFTSSDPAATLPANYTFTSLDAGKHTFFVAFGTAGSQSITVTDTVTATITGTLSGINVTFAMFGEPPPSQDADADPTDASRDLPDGDVPSPRAVLLANAVLSPLPGGISIQEEVGTAALALLLTAGRMDRRRCNKRTRSD